MLERITAVTVVGLGLLICSLSASQAQQGARDTPVAGTIFTSPMVLNVRFAAVDQTLWGKGGWFSVAEYQDLGKFTCDGVSLRRPEIGLIRKSTWGSGLELAARMKDAKTVEVKARVNVYNPPNNHDKGVTVVLELLDGATTVQTATVGPLKVEDKGIGREGQATFVLPLELLWRKPQITLRVTVMAKDI